MAGESAAAGGVLKGIGSAAAGAGSKAAGALGALKGATGLAGGAGAAASAGPGVIWGAGAAAGPNAVSALKNISFVMMIIGGVYFFVKLVVGYSTLTLILSFLLFIFAGYAVSNKVQVDKFAVFIPMAIWILWYFVFGGNYDPNFLMYFGGISILILFGSMVITKGRVTRPELWGLLPVLFFYLDAGLIPFLVETLGFAVKDGFEYMVLFMPWWAFFGLLMLPTEEGKGSNTVINVARVIGILYLVVVILIPVIPTVAYENSVVPGLEDLEGAQEQLREQAPKTENPGWSNFICTLQAIQNVADIGGFDVDDCVAERQLNSQVKYTCSDVYGFTEGSSDYNRCLEDEKTRIEEDEQQTAQGTVDRSILEKTEASFKVDRNSFPTKRVVSVGTTQALQYPINLEIENPREQELGITLICNFTKTGSSDNSESFLGEISPSSSITFNEKSDTLAAICSPPSGQLLNGSYTLTYQAEFSGLETTSTLTRMFVEDYDENNELLAEARSTYFSGTNALSSAPDEFARINFGFGQPETNPIIEKDDNLLLVSSIENAGTGKIINVNDYFIDLEPYMYNPGDLDVSCLQGGTVIVPDKTSKGSDIPLSLCFLEWGAEMEDLIAAQDFVVQSFDAILNYDYQISTQNTITVTIV
ncbi:MAG: hypothetical protein KJ896_03220 [Nanoarchaeota archaeon]|nr:hypothetical protein [Nanoarchaeota archaeon]